MSPRTPSFFHERQYWQQGITYIAGVDEVGVGALAGPVVAAAVVFAPTTHVRGIRDSKQLLPAQRQTLLPYIKTTALCWAVAEASIAEISRLNIYHAARLAMRRALEQLEPQPHFFLVDGLSERGVHSTIPGEAIVKGDAVSFTIAAASIVAKEYRDALMKKLHEEFPAYGFADHKGYATARHKQALTQLGSTPYHRPTYAPVARVKSLR
jgi:ribonuclease HII